MIRWWQNESKVNDLLRTKDEIKLLFKISLKQFILLFLCAKNEFLRPWWNASRVWTFISRPCMVLMPNSLAYQSFHRETVFAKHRWVSNLSFDRGHKMPPLLKYLLLTLNQMPLFSIGTQTCVFIFWIFIADIEINFFFNFFFQKNEICFNWENYENLNYLLIAYVCKNLKVLNRMCACAITRIAKKRPPQPITRAHRGR